MKLEESRRKSAKSTEKSWFVSPGNEVGAQMLPAETGASGVISLFCSRPRLSTAGGYEKRGTNEARSYGGTRSDVFPSFKLFCCGSLASPSSLRWTQGARGAMCVPCSASGNKGIFALVSLGILGSRGSNVTGRARVRCSQVGRYVGPAHRSLWRNETLIQSCGLARVDYKAGPTNRLP